MRIFEIMSFDPSWFLTIPGLLITGGVFLLLVALIVFITTSKKEKGANVDPTVEGSIPLVEGPDNVNNGMVNESVPNNMNAGFANMPMDNMAGMGVVNNPNINAMGMNNMNNMNNNFNQMDGVNNTPVMPEYNVGNLNNTPAYEQPRVAPTPDVPVMPTNTNIEFSGVPGVTINDTVDPEMKPVIDLGTVSPNPVVDFPTSTESSISQPTPVVENNSINNVNSTFVKPESQTVNRPIYGGANPLENTASIPTVTNHTAYNGEPIIPNSVINEVKVVDSVPSANVETPAVINNQTQPVSAADIFNTSVEPSKTETIATPTPVVESAAPSVNSVQSNDGGIETLNF